MMKTHIPSGLPSLATGSHSPGGGHACIMEYVSLIAGLKWGDSPACVFPTIQGVARTVNDNGSGSDRARLLALVPRLLTANLTSEQMTAKGLTYTKIEEALMKAVINYGMKMTKEKGGGFITWYGVGACGIDFSGHPTVVYQQVVSRETNNHRGVELLTEVLDAFDRIVGRTSGTHRKVTDREYRQATKQISSKVRV